MDRRTKSVGDGLLEVALQAMQDAQDWLDDIPEDKEEPVALSRFVVGDYVRVRHEEGGGLPEMGLIGRVRAVQPEGAVGVEFLDFDGHNLGGVIQTRRGYWFFPNHLPFNHNLEVIG